LYYKVIMNTFYRLVAAIELCLVLPATIFMSALFLRNIQPSPYEPAQTARRVVDWFAARPHIGLGVLLIAMPFAALTIGTATVIRRWKADSEFRRSASATVVALRVHLAPLITTGATLVAAGILAIVALHMIAD